MKNIIKIFFAAMAIFAFGGCSETGPGNEDGNGQTNDSIEFTVKALKIDGTSVTIKVEHDGTTANPWYGFYTTETDAMKAYQNKVKELLKNGKVTDLNYKTSLTKTLKDLKPNTDYVYVAFGITEDGEIYGAPGHTKFKTGKNQVPMIENPAWTVEYAGPNTIKDKDYKYTAKVTSTDENKYFVTAYDKYTYEMASIGDIAEYELAYLKAYIEAMKEQEGYEQITLDDVLITGTYIEALNILPGEWYAIAIGVNDEGELSGLYAVTDLINIPLEKPTPEYSAWLGDWTWTGANGNTANITFVQDNPNYTYYLLGWDGYGKELGVDPAIPVEWVSEQNLWLIYPSFIAEAEFQTTGGTTVPGELYIMGTYQNAKEEKYFHGFNNPICLGSIDENGTKYSIGYEGTDQDNGEFTIEFMEYIAFIEINGQLSASPATSTDLPSFPITITPAVEEGTGNGGEEGGEGNTTAPTSLKKMARKAPVFSKLPSNKVNTKSVVTLR